MKDNFWHEVWEYLGEVPIEVAKQQIPHMWEVKDAYQYIQDPDNDQMNTYYEYLCMVCRTISQENKEKLPENLHSRIVLGPQNRYTKEYIGRWGV